MIVTVTLNPAVDVTYVVDDLTPGSTHQLRRWLRRAGGKGINVARVAAALGASVHATGLAGGRNGDMIVAELSAVSGVRPAFAAIAAESRQTVTVVSPSAHPTEFREAGPTVTPAEWRRFIDLYRGLVAEAAVVTLSGSLPPGLPADAYATLTTIGKELGATMIVDAGADPLRLACAAGPHIVKPNEAELRASVASTGSLVASRSLVAGASSLLSLGAGAVVVSCGRDGSIAVTPAGSWRVHHPPVAGNPVGAGDSLVAGLAVAADRAGYPWSPSAWREALVSATSLAMATVLSPVAGAADLDEARLLADKITIESMEELR